MNDQKHLTEKELIDRVAALTEETPNKIRKILTTVQSELFDHLEEEECSASFAPLGKFYSKRLKARQGRNPKTGETVQVPAKVTLRFKASTTFKKSANS